MSNLKISIQIEINKRIVFFETYVFNTFPKNGLFFNI